METYGTDSNILTVNDLINYSALEVVEAIEIYLMDGAALHLVECVYSEQLSLI